MFYEYKGARPIVNETAFVHPTAVITGHVEIGAHVYIGPHAAIRGDWGKIVIEDGCNVQENCTIHMFPGVTVTLHKNAHIGHGAVIHGANIGENCLVGMNAVVMDQVTLGKECIVGALAFIKAKSTIPERSLIVGNPAKIVKEVSDKMIAWKSEGTKLYQLLAKEMHEEAILCEPLHSKPNDYPELPQPGYKTWKEHN